MAQCLGGFWPHQWPLVSSTAPGFNHLEWAGPGEVREALSFLGWKTLTHLCSQDRYVFQDKYLEVSEMSLPLKVCKKLHLLSSASLGFVWCPCSYLQSSILRRRFIFQPPSRVEGSWRGVWTRAYLIIPGLGEGVSGSKA